MAFLRKPHFSLQLEFGGFGFGEDSYHSYQFRLAVPKLLVQTWFILNPSFFLGVWNFARQRVPMGLASDKDPGHGSLRSFHGGCHHNVLLEKLSLSCMFPDRSTLAPKI